MFIEISIGELFTQRIPDGEDDHGNIWYVEEEDIVYEHHGYFETIDEAIEELQRLKEQEKPSIWPRCDKCVYIKGICGNTDEDNLCKKYKRDPPDGGFYG